MANLKRHMIELVKEIKEGEIITEKYLTPIFIPLEVVYEAIDLSAELEKPINGANDEKDRIEKMLSFVADKVFGGQFTKDELRKGLHAPTAIQTLQEQILFVARGMQNDDTKKYLAKKH